MHLERMTFENFPNLIKVIFKSLVWVFGTIIFGLLQLWLVWGSSLYDTTVTFTLEKFIIDGALLFFVAAIITSVTIDHLLSKKNTCCSVLEILLFIVFPFIILIFVVWLFAICYGKPIENLDYELIFATEVVLLIIAFIYSFFIKLHAFK